MEELIATEWAKGRSDDVCQLMDDGVDVMRP